MFYEEVGEGATELAGAIDGLIESLKLLLKDATNFHVFQILAVELQSACADMKRTKIKLSSTLQDHLRLFELSRGRHD
jgi:hypothetical protein